ncbi:hypothetical protein Krac_6911 [Ktedonobacter racemifer DSM 44963]|uniref:Uncharacterized protein n=1 Tax=Ktedonobacter racemifer DSM 44963 TaxID=485913 RepID=D6TQ33_KTERA|nr:hypothetical protein Krac_6911 [Ktedonobacter racemifer DSM 44963]
MISSLIHLRKPNHPTIDFSLKNNMYLDITLIEKYDILSPVVDSSIYKG